MVLHIHLDINVLLAVIMEHLQQPRVICLTQIIMILQRQLYKMLVGKVLISESFSQEAPPIQDIYIGKPEIPKQVLIHLKSQFTPAVRGFIQRI